MILILFISAKEGKRTISKARSTRIKSIHCNIRISSRTFPVVVAAGNQYQGHEFMME
jgi:hypothetical protein